MHASTQAPLLQMFAPVHAIDTPPTWPVASQLWTSPSWQVIPFGTQSTQPRCSSHRFVHAIVSVNEPPLQVWNVEPEQRVAPSMHSGPGASTPPSSSPLPCCRPPGPHATS